MVTALKRQLAVAVGLRRQRWQRRNADYFGEVASKLRLLIVQGKSNRPLLLAVADAYGVPVSANEPGDPDRSFGQLLDGQMLKIGENAITFREVICRWAEQSGGAHEDWALDEMLTKTWTDARVNNVSLGESNLTAVAVKVVFRANELLIAMGSLPITRRDDPTQNEPLMGFATWHPGISFSGAGLKPSWT